MSAVNRSMIGDEVFTPGEKVLVDPTVLTPAGKQAMRSMIRAFVIAFLILGLSFAGALGFYVHNTEKSARCVALKYTWDGLTLNNRLANHPLSLDGFTGQLLLARQEANGIRKVNSEIEIKALGKRPTC